MCAARSSGISASTRTSRSPRRISRRTTGRGTRSRRPPSRSRSEEHTSELQSRVDLVCRLLLEKKKKGRPEEERAGARRGDGAYESGEAAAALATPGGSDGFREPRRSPRLHEAVCARRAERL